MSQIDPELPTVGGDVDVWGGILNTAIDEVVDAVNDKTDVPTEGVATLLALPYELDNMWRYNQASYSQDNTIELSDGTIYAVGVRTGDLHPIVSKRLPGASVWETFDLRTIAGDPFGNQTADGHNTFVLGVDPVGNIHVSGNMHGVALKYAKTTVPGDITTFATAPMVGTDENSVSYPIFVNDAAGFLYFWYRNGSSTTGNIYVNLWNGTGWARVALVLEGVPSATGPYINHVSPNYSGGFDIMYMWRETESSESNERVGYVRRTASTWLRSDGTPQPMPITPENAETILPIASGAGLINQTGLDVDDNNMPHGAFMWYDAAGNTQYFHVWFDGDEWHTEQVSAFTDRVETIAVVGTLQLVVARPQIFCVEGRVFIAGRARSTAGNRAILIDATAPGHPFAVLFDMDLTEWEPAFDQRAVRRSGILRMLVTDVDSPASAGHGFERQWGGILSVDLAATSFFEGSAPLFGRADAGRPNGLQIRGSMAANTDLNNISGIDHIGAWLLGTGVVIVNQPGYGVTRPAILTVTKGHRAVTVQTIVDVEAQVFMRFGNAGVWSPWTVATGGSLAAVANGTSIVSLWHGDYLLSSGASNAYPGEPTDFAALNVAGILEVRLIASSGTTGTKFFRLTTFDRTEAWEATSSGSTLSAWLQTRGT